MGLFDKIGQFDKLVYQYYTESNKERPPKELNQLENKIDELYKDIIASFKSQEAKSIANAKPLTKCTNDHPIVNIGVDKLIPIHIEHHMHHVVRVLFFS